MSYFHLVRREPRALAFGFMQSSAATVGQTFVIALFLPSIKAELGIGDAQAAGFFTIATLASAAAISAAGRWIDHVDLLRYSAASAAVLVAGCIAAAFATSPVLFLLALFALRFGGNGLLNHIALTSAARYFARDRGKALSLVASGFSFGEAALGIAVAFLLDAFGRRASFIAIGAVAGVLALISIALVRDHAAFRRIEHSPHTADAAGGARVRRRDVAPRSFFALCAPLFLATPLVITAFVFHLGVIAAAKGLTLQWFAVSFVAFAVTRVASSIAVGPAIDRYGSDALFAAHLLPFCVGVALLAAGDGAWVAPAYWILTGITGGLAATLQVAVIAEHVPASRLGRARSVLASGTIVAAAAGPALYGALLGAEVRVEHLLWGSVAAMLAATVLGFAAIRGRAIGSGFTPP